MFRNTFYASFLILHRLSFERCDDFSARCRVFVKFRTESRAEEEVIDEADMRSLSRVGYTNRKTAANQWILSIIAKMYNDVDIGTLRQLNAPDPPSTNLVVLRKTVDENNAASDNGKMTATVSL